MHTHYVDVSPFLGDEPASIALSAVRARLQTLLHTVSTYVPQWVRMPVVQEGRLPRATLCEGSVLFADVSGFTRLSERLRQSELAREGAEVITQAVNAYFDRIALISARYGGSVLKFGGDASLIFFEGVDHAWRACLTALRVQQQLRHSPMAVDVEGETFPLFMSIGIGSGTLFLDILGDERKRELAILGPALQRMGRAESFANAGEIVVDAYTAESVSSRLRLTPHPEAPSFAYLHIPESPLPEYAGVVWPQLTYTPPNASLEDDIAWLAHRLHLLTPFLPFGLLERLRLSPETPDVLDEVRWATIVFAEMPAIAAISKALDHYTPEHVSEILNGYFTCMSDCIRRYEGIVNKLSVSPTGLQIMATFGAPRAHEDDAQRATLAALNMLSAVREQALRQGWPDEMAHGIGLNTGFVFAGNVGGMQRREYTVMGDEVNTAYRVMSVAEPGTVVLTEATMQQVRQNIVIWPLEARRVKGKRAPLMLYRAVEPKSGGMEWRWEYPLVNRKKELRLFDEAIDAVLSGHGRFIHVEGEAGVGKSRLVGEVVRRMGQRGLVTILTICLSYSREVPYMPWVDILRTLLDLPNENTEAHVRAALAEIDAEEWAPLVGEMLGIPIPDTSFTAALPPQLRRQRLFEVVWRLLEANIPLPGLAIFIEDAQWADDASLDLLNTILPRISSQPILLCAVHRPRDAFGQQWQPWGTHIRLEPLTVEDIAQLIANLLHTLDIPEELRTFVFQKSQGNPLFAQELARTLQENAMVRHEAEHLIFESPFDEQVPDTIHNLLQSRIDRLPEQERRVLQTAACIGQTFSLDLLTAIYPHEHVHQSLARLVERGLLLSESFSTVPTYTFAHTLTQEVAHQSLSFSRRRVLHRQIADYLERTSSHDLTAAVAAMLAYHFYEGEVWEKAAVYAFQAGAMAQREYANETAVAMFRRALKAIARLSPLPSEMLALQFDALAHLGASLSLIGEYDEAMAAYRQAESVLPHAFAPSEHAPRRADLFLHMAEVMEKQSEFEKALALVEQGLAELQEAPEAHLQAARLYRLGAGIYHRLGANDKALAWCRRGLAELAHLDTDSSKRTRAHLLFLMAEIARRFGKLEEAADLAHQSAKMYEELEDIQGLSQAHITLGNVYFDWGRLDDAALFYNKGMELKKRIGDVYGVGVMANNLGEVYLYQGDFERAQEAYQQSMQIWEELGSAFGQAVLHNNLAVVAMKKQQWHAAMQHLNASEALLHELGVEDLLVEVMRHKAECWLGIGHLTEAQAAAEVSLEMARRQKMQLEEGIALRILGQIALHASRLKDAARCLERALDALQDVESPYELAQTYVVLSRLAIARQAFDEAYQYRERARALFEQIGAMHELAQLQDEDWE